MKPKQATAATARKMSGREAQAVNPWTCIKCRSTVYVRPEHQKRGAK